jgi:hypothetical protein
MSRISRALLALMIVLLSAAHVWAQATAQINGTSRMQAARCSRV